MKGLVSVDLIGDVMAKYYEYKLIKDFNTA